MFELKRLSHDAIPAALIKLYDTVCSTNRPRPKASVAMY